MKPPTAAPAMPRRMSISGPKPDPFMILPVAQPAIRPTRITQIIQNIETSSIFEDGNQPASFLKMPDGQSDCHGSLFAWEEHCQAEGARPSSVRPLLTCSGVRQSSTPLTASPGPG